MILIIFILILINFYFISFCHKLPDDVKNKDETRRSKQLSLNLSKVLELRKLFNSFTKLHLTNWNPVASPHLPILQTSMDLNDADLTGDEEMFSSQNNSPQASPPTSPPDNNSPNYSPLPSNRPARMSTSEDAVTSLLEELDSGKALSIWNHLQNKESDLLVKEYLNIIQKVKVMPEHPTTSVLDSIPSPVFELPNAIQISVLNMFTSYLQCRYSALNINEALTHEKCLFSPFISFKIPQFNLLPQEYFQECFDFKKTFVKGIQASAVNGLAFTMELILLRILDEIHSHVQSTSNANNEEEEIQNVQYFFLTFFSAAESNFKDKFKIKSIDWEKKECRVKNILPKWRRDKSAPPIVASNRYAKELSKKVKESSVKITPLGIITQTNNQPSTSGQGQVSIPTVNSKQGNGGKGVKALTKNRNKVNQVQVQQKNARGNNFNKNRKLAFNQAVESTETNNDNSTNQAAPPTSNSQ